MMTVEKTDNKDCGKTVYITNRMRCPWIVPHQLFTSAPFKSDSEKMKRDKQRQVLALVSKRTKIVPSNESIEVLKSYFDGYIKYCPAFQAQFDTKMLVLGKKKRVDRESLKRGCTQNLPPEFEMLGSDVLAHAVGKQSKIALNAQLSHIKPHNVK